MEYVWKSSLWIVRRVFQRATQRPRILLTDHIQSGEAAVSTTTNYWDYWSSDHPFQVYYKVRQLLLQSATAYNYFITKCDKCYYKVRELLKSATILSQSAIGITKCDDYYKGRQNKAIALCCCGATVGSEQQHNQDLREIYKGRRILEFITFYHNALHLTRVHWATNKSNKNTGTHRSLPRLRIFFVANFLQHG